MREGFGVVSLEAMGEENCVRECSQEVLTSSLGEKENIEGGIYRVIFSKFVVVLEC